MFSAGFATLVHTSCLAMVGLVMVSQGKAGGEGEEEEEREERHASTGGSWD